MRKDLSHYPNDQDEMKNKKKSIYKEVIINIFNMNLNGSSREWNFLSITNCHVRPLNSYSKFKVANYKKPRVI